LKKVWERIWKTTNYLKIAESTIRINIGLMRLDYGLKKYIEKMLIVNTSKLRLPIYKMEEFIERAF